MEADEASLASFFSEFRGALKRGAFNVPQKTRNKWLQFLDPAATADKRTIRSAIKLGEEMLFHSAILGCDEIVVQLLSVGMNKDSASGGATPLFGAAVEGHLGVIRILVEGGADLNSACIGGPAWPRSNEYMLGYTPLLVAARRGHLAAAKILVSAGADLDKADPSGATPIFQASRLGRCELVQILADAGADLSRGTDKGWTPLSIAALNGHLGVMRVLVAAGADLNEAVHASPVERLRPEVCGSAPLLVAANKGHEDIVRFLIEAGADVEVRHLESGVTPMLAAAGNNRLGVVRLLLEAGADIDSKGDDGYTALFFAALRGQTRMVRYLVERGAALDGPVYETAGRMPLIAASVSGYVEIIKCLVEAGANPSAISSTGATPLGLSFLCHCSEAIDYLLEHGAEDPQCKVIESPRFQIQLGLCCQVFNC